MTNRHIHPAAAILAIATVLAGILLAFVLPALRSTPHDLPIGVAGPPPAAVGVQGALSAKAPGAFEVTSYDSGEALQQAIRDRQIYGGLALAPESATLYTASAASPAVTQLLATVGGSLASSQHKSLTVVDVVALPPDDPRGVGLATSLLPLLIGSMAPAVIIGHLVRRPGRQILALAAGALTYGYTLAAVMHGVGAFAGNWWKEGAAMALILAAMSFTLAGTKLLGGLPAFGAAAATFLLLGNPLSGATSAPEFLTGFWGWLGQSLPPGAGAQLLRCTSYFDGSGAIRSLLVLGCWLLSGITLHVVRATTRRERPVGAARATAETPAGCR